METETHRKMVESFERLAAQLDSMGQREYATKVRGQLATLQAIDFRHGHRMAALLRDSHYPQS